MSKDEGGMREVLGVTDTGNCARHPNCPVFTADKVVSCRICFSEEKSAGFATQKSFTAVIAQLQNIATGGQEATPPEEACGISSKLLEQPQALESILKRITQVQNWEARQKERELNSLKLQVQRLEQLLAESEMTVNEQKQTIRALRLNIQQDLKIIKTMTLQKQREDDLDMSISSISSTYSKQSPKAQKGKLTSPLTKESPSSKSRPKSQKSQIERLRQVHQTTSAKPGAIYGLQAYQNAQDDDEDTNEESSHRQRRTSYWNDDDVDSFATNPSQIFMSFRGGLLDIPKSPPSVSHDRQKLKLDMSALQALRAPSMRSVRRTVSGSQSSVTSATLEPREIQLDALAGEVPSSGSSNRKPPHQITFQGTHNGMPHLPFGGSNRSLKSTHSDLEDSTSLVSPMVNKDPLSISSPEKLAAKSPTLAAAQSPTKDPLSLNQKEEEENTEDESTGDKFIFSVTQAECHDKYGDTGIYTGTILVTEGLPHGRGTMNYESGRVYSGDWVSGQWHGQGKLLNPNGDTYEGDFVLDARHGQGIYRWDNGDVYIGEFVQDKRHGKGRFNFHNGNVYEGDFVDGMFEGNGKYKSEIGQYEGEWKQGRYDGQGELQYADGGKYTGEFRNSVAHGFGLEITADGKRRRGVWEQGQPAEYFERT